MNLSEIAAGDIVPTDVGYNRWAELYDCEDNPLLLLEESLIAPLIGDVAGLDVADVGCGTGRRTIPLAAAGAKVTALDFSEGMLERARAKDGAKSCELYPTRFDAAISIGKRFFRSCCLLPGVGSYPEFKRFFPRIGSYL